MKNLIVPYPLYEIDHRTNVPIEQLFINQFNRLPSKIINKQQYNSEIIDYLKIIGFNQILKNEIIRNEIINEIILLNEFNKMIIRIYGRSVDEISYNMDIFYSLELGEINNQLDFNLFENFIKPKKKSNINLIKSISGYLDIEEYDILVPELNIELNYGKSFMSIYETIIKRLNKPNDKGIILFHGEPGTGKTSFIKYLTKMVTHKEILFIPPSMVEILSDPSIIPFLMEHKNSILIIEDAERVISNRKGNVSAAGVSNLLNLTDGILGDCLNIQVIATFNMEKEDIDKALLRPGRLIAEHKFDKLNITDTNILLEQLNKGIVSDKEMTLADIYNIDVEIHRTNNKQSNIGFM
jgi:hypothetical protein